MALASVGSFLATSNKTAGTSVTVTTSAQLDSGNLGIIAIAFDNLATADGASTDCTSVTVGGQAVTKIAEYTNGLGAAAGGSALWVGYIIASGNIASGSNVVANFSGSVTAKALVGWEFTRDTSKTITLDGIANLDQDGTLVDMGSVAISGAENVEHVWVRLTASERNVTSAMTPTSGWTEITRASTSGGAGDSNITALGEFVISTGTSATSDPTLGVNDSISIGFGLYEAGAAPAGQPTMRRWGGVPGMVGAGRIGRGW